ncbi:MAG TPA: transketolase [Syntrophales bacterium]|nr:transketolase [Syntrophales bacterium]HOX93190.1 transketolase [Syntrophales bacterium]HPI57632.1 transketolase [Syntrophales bacterium]HPN25355.1 transketolase [Syntrophales bacterium]HQM29647.1 transketolase [Syntrophales bacterium]
MTDLTDPIHQRCINTIRMLAVDAIEKAKSGHPGLPLGSAPMAYVLWTQHLKHNPANPRWVDRDRFVLSGGHGSMLLYALLHLTGYDLTLEDIKSFRQWESRAPGHPESHVTPGVEVTTGPLGQGLSNAVGMAIAEAHLAARYNRPGHTIVDHYTYVIASDGDIMEGVAAEACSLAGHLRLGKLIVLYDDNGISLAGSTTLCFTEDTGDRLAAYGWHVQKVPDGNDLGAIDRALRAAREETMRPSIIFVRTIIGFGAPHKQGTFEAHGAPLGPEEALQTKKNLGWPLEPLFYIPGDALQTCREAVRKGKAREAQWAQKVARYVEDYPVLAAEFKRRLVEEHPAGWSESLPAFPAGQKGPATRKASEEVMQVLAGAIPGLVGGSADLNNSTFTWLKGLGDFQAPGTSDGKVQGAVGGGWDHGGRNIHFGVREHAMGAIAVGMAAHGGFIPYTATFLIFSDYMRPPIRLAALSGHHVIFLFTHDSIGLGEDGPTHQPVEQIMSLRAVPDLTVIRPADGNETVAAWKLAIERKKPVALILTRQNLPALNPGTFPIASGVPRGAYILKSGGEKPDVILIATGSEVQLALGASENLDRQGVKARVVSMPSWELFQEQPPSYRDEVLPPSVRKRVAIEAGATLGWWRWVGDEGDVIGIDRFGSSAPGNVVMEKFGFSVDNVVKKALSLLKKS